MSVVSPVTALVSAALPVAVGLAAGERLRGTAPAGLALALAAVVIVSGGLSASGSRATLASLSLACAAGTAIALQLICLNQAPHSSGVGPLIVGRAISSAVVLSAVGARRSRLGSSRPSVPLCVCAGGLDSLAYFAFLLAVRHGELAVVAVITALYPAGTILLSRALLGERVASTQLIGLALGAVAVSLLAIA